MSKKKEKIAFNFAADLEKPKMQVVTLDEMKNVFSTRRRMLEFLCGEASLVLPDFDYVTIRWGAMIWKGEKR